MSKMETVLKCYLTFININNSFSMPQLVPFYFINEVFFAFTILTYLIYMLSKYILPRFVRLFLSRVFIYKLF